MESRFTLSVPFNLSDGKDIKDLPHICTLAGNDAELKSNGMQVVCVVRGLANEVIAHTIFRQLSDALNWAALKTGIGITFRREISSVHRPENPIEVAKNIGTSFGLKKSRVDAVVDGGEPYIVGDDEALLTITGSPVGLCLSYNPASFVHSLEEGIAVIQARGPISSKLRLACEMYSQTHFLSSGFAQFQSLFIPLEVVAPAAKDIDNAAILNKIKQWQNDARVVRATTLAQGQEAKDWAALESRLGQLRKISHKTRIQEFVRTMLQADNHDDADAKALIVKRLYDKRGSLTHEGLSADGSDVATLDQIVRPTLLAAWRHMES